MVERQAARRAYEDFLHRKQDPALLEQAAGNQFQARVFPIPAAGVKELIVAFAQELAGHADYALPLRGMPEIAQLDVALSLAGSGAVARQLHQQRVVPTEDFVYEPAAARPTQGLRSGELVLARVHPVIEDAPDPMTSAVVLFDTSASRALGFDDQLELLGSFARELALRGGPQAQLTVACFSHWEQRWKFLTGNICSSHGCQCGCDWPGCICSSHWEQRWKFLTGVECGGHGCQCRCD